MSNFDKKWSELSKEESAAMKEQFGSKQAWQDAKARSEGYMNEQDRRGNSGERHDANNPPTVSIQPVGDPIPAATPSTSTANTSNNSTTSKSSSSLPSISSQMEGYATDAKYRGPDGKMYTAKQADDAGWTAGYYELDQERYQGETGNLYKMADALGVSYGDSASQTHSKVNQHLRRYGAPNDYTGPSKQEMLDQAGVSKSMIGQDSLKEVHAGKAPGEYITGPAGPESPYLQSLNESAGMLQATGYDYNMDSVKRHSNQGKEKSMTSLYDDFGGYQNWYDNYSIYSGNFTGAKDIKTWDEIKQNEQTRSQISQDHANAVKEGQDSFMQRLGFDNYNFSKGSWNYRNS